MTPEQKKVREILDFGYTLDFGSVFETAFNNYKKTALLTGVAYLIIILILFALIFGISMVFVGVSFASKSYINYNLEDEGIVGILIMLLAGAIFSGISTPLIAGFIHMADDAHHKKEVTINTVFKFYKHEKFKNLFVYGVIIGIISSALSSTVILFLHPASNILISVFVSLFTCLAIPLIIYANNNPMDAFQNSVRLVAKNPIIIAGLLIVAYLFAFVGLIAICLGVLFTLPFIYAMIHSIYIHIIPSTPIDELEEIGNF